MADHENELTVTLTFDQACEYTEAARQSDPYRAPESVLGEWLALAGITPAPNLDVQAAAERAARIRSEVETHVASSWEFHARFERGDADRTAERVRPSVLALWEFMAELHPNDVRLYRALWDEAVERHRLLAQDGATEGGE